MKFEKYIAINEIKTAYDEAKTAHEKAIAEPSENAFSIVGEKVRTLNKLLASEYYGGQSIASVTLDTLPKVKTAYTAKGAKENLFAVVDVPANVVEWAKVRKENEVLDTFKKIRAVCCLLDMQSKVEDLDKADARVDAYRKIGDEFIVRECIEKKKYSKSALKEMLSTFCTAHGFENRPVSADANHLAGYVRKTKAQEGKFVDAYLTLSAFGESLSQTIHRIITAGIYEDYTKK